MRFFRMPHLKWKKEQISASATVAAITATAASESIIAPSAAAAKKKDDPQTTVIAAAITTSATTITTPATAAAEERTIQRQELFSPHPFPFPPQPQLFAHPLSQPHPQFVAVNSLIVKSSERFFDLQCYSMRRKRKCEMRNYL